MLTPSIKNKRKKVHLMPKSLLISFLIVSVLHSVIIFTNLRSVDDTNKVFSKNTSKDNSRISIKASLKTQIKKHEEKIDIARPTKESFSKIIKTSKNSLKKRTKYKLINQKILTSNLKQGVTVNSNATKQLGSNSSVSKYISILRYRIIKLISKSKYRKYIARQRVIGRVGISINIKWDNEKIVINDTQIFDYSRHVLINKMATEVLENLKSDSPSISTTEKIEKKSLKLYINNKDKLNIKFF